MRGYRSVDSVHSRLFIISHSLLHHTKGYDCILSTALFLLINEVQLNASYIVHLLFCFVLSGQQKISVV